jgi:hypothetical protein
VWGILTIAATNLDTIEDCRRGCHYSCLDLQMQSRNFTGVFGRGILGKDRSASAEADRGMKAELKAMTTRDKGIDSREAPTEQASILKGSK